MKQVIFALNGLGTSTFDPIAAGNAGKVAICALSDLGGVNVDCDLPDYLHEDIVRQEVNLYRQAVTGSIGTAQGQQQNQQREDTRNNANPYATQQQ